jgi:hypothetical protein
VILVINVVSAHAANIHGDVIFMFFNCCKAHHTFVNMQVLIWAKKAKLG